MTRLDPELTELRQAVGSPSLVVVVGTGVSIATCKNQDVEGHKVASWTGLIEHGLARCIHERLLSDKQQQILRLQLESGEVDDLTKAGETITEKLRRQSDGAFHRWLKESVGELKVEKPELILAIAQLGGIVATLNYDSLIEKVTRRAPVTWQQKEKVEAVLARQTIEAAGHNVDGILHLHGYWDEPSSVVLGLRSYDAVKSDLHAQMVLRLFTMDRKLLFIGCRTTLEDPNFTLLTAWASEARGKSIGRHFLLHHRGDEPQVHAFLKQHADWLTPVCYGSSHDALPAFLHDLSPDKNRAPHVTCSAPVESRAGSVIPAPPAFCAARKYIGGHVFVGRAKELGWMDEWAKAQNPNALLMFEAIGGAGKSMVTWYWATERATAVRTEWAGRFWYSFYERGAQMSDFCRRALAYMTGQPLEVFSKRKTAELVDPLLQELNSRPWLFVLDGLERVLVAYHRFNSWQLPDEEVLTARTLNARDRYVCIRDDDDDLLRRLSQAGPSKVLVSSRLMPRAFLNVSEAPIPGVEYQKLLGLYPEDAELLLRQAGAAGDSGRIRTYLQNHCACHPLTTGVVAGLVAKYPRAPKNFDGWASDPEHGGRLDFAELDLAAKRNHILGQALDSLDESARCLLSSLALISEAVDYDTILALNPHRPSPQRLEGLDGTGAPATAPATMLDAWRLSPEARVADKKLGTTLASLRQCGLLQFDERLRAYDLHPVVRGVALCSLNQEETSRFGQRIVDHFSQRAPLPYEHARTLDEMRNALHVMRALIHMKQWSRAYDFYCGEFSNALFYNVEAHHEALELLQPFFPNGFDQAPVPMARKKQSYLLNDAGLVMTNLGHLREALATFNRGMQLDLEARSWISVLTNLAHLFVILRRLGRPAQACACASFERKIAEVRQNDEYAFAARLRLVNHLTDIGQYDAAEELWQDTNKMGRSWNREVYRPGHAEWVRADLLFVQQRLQETDLNTALDLSRSGNHRAAVRSLLVLHGRLCLERQEWTQAADRLHQAVTMTREVGQEFAVADALLAVCKFHLGKRDIAHQEALRLEGAKEQPSLVLAELWLLLGNRDRAVTHTCAAYKKAWADGEPHVFRWELNRARDVLERLSEPVPDLTGTSDAADSVALPWQEDLVKAIAELRNDPAERL